MKRNELNASPHAYGERMGEGYAIVLASFRVGINLTPTMMCARLYRVAKKSSGEYETPLNTHINHSYNYRQ